MQRFLERDEDDLQQTWAILDMDGDGVITKNELVVALEACGIKMAPWELRDMMEQADADGNGTIDYTEFQACYASLPWSRVQGLSRLLQEIKEFSQRAFCGPASESPHLP